MQDRLPPDRRKPLATGGRTIHLGQKRRFKSLPATSGLPPSTDIIRPVRLVRLAQEAEIARTANATWLSGKAPSLPHNRRRKRARRANQQNPVQPRWQKYSA